MRLEKVVILANGEFPTHPLPLSILKESNSIVCCDGAAVKLVQLGLKPLAIVGDLDSLPHHFKERYGEIIHQDRGQEDNDLSKAFRFVQRYSPKEITILGATGKREDHTLGNISLLAEYAELCSAKIEMVTNSGQFTLARESGSYPSYRGMQLSLFSMECKQEVISQGLKHPLEGVKFDTLWKATLNETIGESFTLQLKLPTPLILYSPHKE